MISAEAQPGIALKERFFMKHKHIMLLCTLTALLLTGCASKEEGLSVPSATDSQTSQTDQTSETSDPEISTDVTGTADESHASPTITATGEESTEQTKPTATASQEEQPTADPASDPVSGETTAEASLEITLHTTTAFSDKYFLPHQKAFDTTDPVEAAKEFVTWINDKPFVYNFEITGAKVFEEETTRWTENLKKLEPGKPEKGGNIMDTYGWSKDMIDRGIFKVVHVDYFANFDHTKTPTSFEGKCFKNVYLIQYEDTGTWQTWDTSLRPCCEDDSVND